jgi:hypothetical protein
MAMAVARRWWRVGDSLPSRRGFLEVLCGGVVWRPPSPVLLSVCRCRSSRFPPNPPLPRLHAQREEGTGQEWVAFGLFLDTT